MMTVDKLLTGKLMNLSAYDSSTGEETVRSEFVVTRAAVKEELCESKKKTRKGYHV